MAKGKTKKTLFGRLKEWSLSQFLGLVRDNYKAFAIILICDALFFGTLLMINDLLAPYASWLASQESTTSLQAQAFGVSVLTLIIQIIVYAAAKNVVLGRFMSLKKKRALGLFSFKRFTVLNLMYVTALWLIATILIIAISQVAPDEGTTAYSVVSVAFVGISILLGIDAFIFGQLLHGAFSRKPDTTYGQLFGDAFTLLYENVGFFCKKIFNALLVIGVYCGLFALFGLAVKTNYRNHPLSLNEFTPTYVMFFTVGMAAVIYLALSYLRYEFYKKE